MLRLAQGHDLGVSDRASEKGSRNPCPHRRQRTPRGARPLRSLPLRSCGSRNRPGIWPGEPIRQGHSVSDRTASWMLGEMGFSLQGNAKLVEGAQHADRDAQFGHLAAQAAEHSAAGQPV